MLRTTVPYIQLHICNFHEATVSMSIAYRFPCDEEYRKTRTFCCQNNSFLKVCVINFFALGALRNINCSLVPRPYHYRRTAWYTLFAHAFNLSNIRVKCRYSSILLRAMITRIDDEKLPNLGSRPIETHDDSVWIMAHASFRYCVSYAVISRLEFLNNLRSITEKMFLYCYPCWKRLCY